MVLSCIDTVEVILSGWRDTDVGLEQLKIWNVAATGFILAPSTVKSFWRKASDHLINVSSTQRLDLSWKSNFFPQSIKVGPQQETNLVSDNCFVSKSKTIWSDWQEPRIL